MSAHSVGTAGQGIFFVLALALMLARSTVFATDPMASATPNDCGNVTPTPDAGPYFRFDPYCGIVQAGDVIDVRVQASTGSGTTRGGTAFINYDNTLFELVGGAGGIATAPESPFVLLPGPVLQGSAIIVYFLYPPNGFVGYEGNLFSFQMKALAPVSGTSLSFGLDSPSTRFAPNVPDAITYGTADFTILTDHRALGDFDSSGCTDLADFLFMLDHWASVFEGSAIDVDEFLALLDNWQQGASC